MEKQEETRQLASHICRNQTENILRPLWGNQSENHQEHLQVDKQGEEKTNKAQAATTPAASTQNITVDTDGLKP